MQCGRNHQLANVRFQAKFHFPGEANKHMIFLSLLLFIFSLCIGSFLNVVIYRMPIILKEAWRQECAQILGVSLPGADSEPHFSFIWPSSHCRHCKQALPFRHLIPLISFVLLKGRCVFCKQKIGWRYPIVELLTATLSVYLLWHFGVDWKWVMSLFFTWLIICLIAIDWEHQLLPDRLTFPLLWLGLLANTAALFTTATAAIWGSVIGYLSLWLIGTIYRLCTKREGMGHGDFKLLAALGAWFGWNTLPMIVLIASLLGLISSIFYLLRSRLTWRAPVAFGPYLGVVGWFLLSHGHLLYG